MTDCFAEKTPVNGSSTTRTGATDAAAPDPNPGLDHSGSNASTNPTAVTGTDVDTEPSRLPRVAASRDDAPTAAEDGNLALRSPWAIGSASSAGHVMMTWRDILVVLWSTAAFLLAFYSLLKPSTTAADLPLVDGALARWLDENYDFRTAVMAGLIVLGPALFWAGTAFRVRRFSFLAATAVVLVSLEFAQRWIPSRGFGWADVVYTLVGIIVVETVVQTTRSVGKWLVAGGE
ncbi:hypothetical protein [Crateriforma spongiae]|uniref:hypothetical protein n=1 Tax=Crateriforma spongiae TaxID=2724528 RepID=UPI0039AF2A55